MVLRTRVTWEPCGLTGLVSDAANRTDPDEAGFVHTALPVSHLSFLNIMLKWSVHGMCSL